VTIGVRQSEGLLNVKEAWGHEKSVSDCDKTVISEIADSEASDDDETISISFPSGEG